MLWFFTSESALHFGIMLMHGLLFRQRNLFRGNSAIMSTVIGKLSNPLQFILPTISVASYLPGRIRCYSELIRNHENNASLLKIAAGRFNEITEFKINTRTGSILISYDVNKVARNSQLHCIEQYLRKIYMETTK